MRRLRLRVRLRVALSVLFVLALIGVPARYAVARYSYLRNFHVVDEGKLYRSSQLTPAALGRVIHDHEINTVVSFRLATANKSDVWEQEFCYKNGVRHLRVKYEAWSADEDKPVPAQKAIDEFLTIIKNPANHPVLVHCLRGVHRTGAFCAVYRMECQRWSNEDAMAEMKALGYYTLDEEEDISTFLRNYVPTWKKAG